MTPDEHLAACWCCRSGATCFEWYRQGWGVLPHTPGDRLTILTNWGVRWAHVQVPGRVSVQLFSNLWAGREYKFSDEGVTWLRGHCDEDSREMQALLAAHALSNEPYPPWRADPP